MPLISVIVPVYKVEPYLRRCVDSILTQTFTDFELILVDDGSPDNCGAICNEYAAKDTRIHVIHQENGGLSAARNAGLDWAFANSDSEWISFIDSDDWVHPKFLKYLYRAVQETNTKVSACLFKRVTEEDAIRDVFFQARIWNWEEYYIRDGVHGAIAWNKLYKKGLFGKYRYPVGKINEDEFLTYRLLEEASVIATVDIELYFYFQNPKGIMNQEYVLSRMDGLDAIAEAYRFAKEKGYPIFYLNRKKAYIYSLSSQIEQCKDSMAITPKKKKDALKKMYSELRKTLILEGKKLAPIKENRWCYETAFPGLSWVYWTSVGVKEKIIKFFKHA